MCKFCEEKEHCYSIHDDASIKIDLDNDLIIDCGEEYYFVINYCPMCGAKLIKD